MDVFLWISSVYKISWIRRIIPCIGDPKGRYGSATLDPISFIFMQFLGKSRKFVCWRPYPRRVDAISYGESWPIYIETFALADLGGAPTRPPPTAQNFLNFMQFSTKFGKIICWRPPPPEGWRPLLRGILDSPLISIRGSTPSMNQNILKNYSDGSRIFQ